jgi:hypothetical protein
VFSAVEFSHGLGQVFLMATLENFDLPNLEARTKQLRRFL